MVRQGARGLQLAQAPSRLRQLARGAGVGALTPLAKYWVRLQRPSLALARAAALAPLRELDSRDPLSWGFSAFSQHDEDGIIDYLTRRIVNPNRYFIEFGAGSGMENNTSWLAVARKFRGIMVEGNSAYSVFSKHLMTGAMIRDITSLNVLVSKENAHEIVNISWFNDPDLLSIDIDGIDYYVARALLEAGLRPKVIVVEYNAAFGPTEVITIKYDPHFSVSASDPFYYGASITAWKQLFGEYGYTFVTVEAQGINAFFLDADHFGSDFVSNLRGQAFRENPYYFRVFGPWQDQFARIQRRHELVHLNA